VANPPPFGEIARLELEDGNMGIGIGVVLLVIGLILVLNAVSIDLSFVNDNTLGWILVIVGVLAIVLALIMNAQRSRTKHVEERRYDGPPPR